MFTLAPALLEVNPMVADFIPEVSILDTEATSWAAHLEQEAEDAHYDALAADALAYDGMMAGLYD